jgi:hypothetical protein
MLIAYCTGFQEQDMFIKYYLEYNDKIPENILSILYDPNPILEITGLQ